MLRVVDCRGNGRSRGRAHGEEAREAVRSALARWEDATGKASGVPIERYVSRFVASTELFATTSRLLPDLAGEMHGIAEGAAVAPEFVVAYNLMDEQWWYDVEADHGCSVVAVADEHRLLLAQNMDLPAFMDGSQLVLRITGPDQPQALVLTSAGMVGLTGVNAAGVAVCVNALLMLPHARRGLPVVAVVRGALMQQSLGAAVGFLRGAPHASGQHYAVASREGVVGIECCAAGTATSFGGTPLVHTNHPLAAATLDPAAVAALQGKDRFSTSQQRLRFLAAHVSNASTREDVQRLLADRTTPVCMVPTRERPVQTFGAVAFSLGDAVTAEFCLGLPGATPWEAADVEAAAAGTHGRGVDVPPAGAEHERDDGVRR